MADPFDTVSDGPVQDDGLVEVGRKRSKPNVPPKYIPSQVYPSPTEEGTFIQTAPAVSRSISRNRRTSYLINQGAGQPLKGPEIKCDYASSPESCSASVLVPTLDGKKLRERALDPGEEGYSSSTATHFIRQPGVSREGSEAVCPKHLRMQQEDAVKDGRRITITRIKPQDIETFKLMRRIQRQQNIGAVQIGLIAEKGMTGEEAQIGPAKYKTTAERRPVSLEQRTQEIGESSSPRDPNWNPDNLSLEDMPMPPRGKRRDYKFATKTTKVKTGNFQPEPKINPELSDEEISRLDPATRNMLEFRRARGVPARGLKNYSSRESISMPMAFTPKPERMAAAFEKIAAEDEVTLNTQDELEKQAKKQRLIEAAKRDPEFRAALESASNRPKLPGKQTKRKALE